MSKKIEKLRPTLWRTVRAILNPIRLDMLKVAYDCEGTLCVRQIARLFRVKDAIASIYLRQMNARGLLGCRREEIKVYYTVSTDRSLPEAIKLQAALKDFFRDKSLGDWEIDLVTVLKGFSHFNRLAAILRLLEGPATKEDLRKAMGVTVKSFDHHLHLLNSARLLEWTLEKRPRLYRLLPPRHPISKVLLEILKEQAQAGISYHNDPGEHVLDTASRVTLRRIAASENYANGGWMLKSKAKPVRYSLSEEALRILEEDAEPS